MSGKYSKREIKWSKYVKIAGVAIHVDDGVTPPLVTIPGRDIPVYFVLKAFSEGRPEAISNITDAELRSCASFASFLIEGMESEIL